MRVKNLASFPILVSVYVDGCFGNEYLVMPGEEETVMGPLFLRVPGGEDIYLTANGSYTVTDSGRYDPVHGVLLVAPGQPSSIVYGEGKKRCGIRAWHFKDR